MIWIKNELRCGPNSRPLPARPNLARWKFIGQTPVRPPALNSIHKFPGASADAGDGNRTGSNRLDDRPGREFVQPAPSLAWILCLTDSATLLGRGWDWSRGRGWSGRRSLLGVLLFSGGFGCCCCPCCFDGGLDGFQFLHRLVAGIHGGLTMTVEVFLGTFQVRFGPFQQADGLPVSVARAASETWRRPAWTHPWRRSLRGGRRPARRGLVLGAETVQG